MSNYFYNNTELPPLPDLTKYDNHGFGAFAYAIIFKTVPTGEYGLLNFNKEPFKYYRESPFDRYELRPLPLDETYMYCSYVIENNEWKENNSVFLENPMSGTANAAHLTLDSRYYELVWSNFDIMDYDNGGVYFHASVPVPVPTPQDFYIVKNGVGQKQDVYLRVDGQWVKQDEYLI